METICKPLSYAEEDEIIKQTLEGHRDAFTYLILKYKDSLFDLAYRILGNRADAEDVLQDAFLDAYKHLKDFHHKARFSTWVYSIVMNRVRNHLRHNKIIRWSSLDIQDENRDDYKPREIAERGPSFIKIMEQRHELEAVQREVRFLPALHQSIFILHYFQDMPLEEISVRLSRPIGTVKVYLHRARQALYKRMRVNPKEKAMPVGRKAWESPTRLRTATLARAL